MDKFIEMLSRYLLLRLFFLPLVVLFLYSPSVAQTQSGREQDNTTVNQQFQVEFPGTLKQTLYIDQYGLELLRQNRFIESFENLDNYKLGLNDLLTIQLNGGTSAILRGITVNAQGMIIIPSIGAVSVEGLTLNEARQKLQKSVDEKLQNTTSNITLDRPRQVHIHINGNIPYPGNYLVSAQTRLNKAIIPALTDGKTADPGSSVTAGRPSQRLDSDFMGSSNYSLRNIIINRQDGTTLRADLLSYYRTGNLKDNPFVRSGDVIRIETLNPYTPGISVSGAVRSELQVEFAPGDTPQKLIDMAGGMRYDAQTDMVFIYRQSASETEKITIPQNKLTSFELAPFDRIVVPFNREKRRSGTASVKGEVQIPGNFPIEDGKTTVFELLEMAGGLNNQALTQAAFLTRNNNSEQILTENINEERIKRASNQVLEGFEYLDMESRLSEGRVYINLADKEQLKSVRLFDGDQLFIPRNEQTVFIFGQVNNPGYYTFNPAEPPDPRRYIERAGGMTIAANMERIFVIKAGNKTWIPVEEATLQSGDMIFVDRIPFESIVEKRAFELQMSQQRNSNISLIMSGVTTITGIITTIVAIRNN